MRRFVLPLSSGLLVCLLVAALVLLGRGSEESPTVDIAPSSAGVPPAAFVQAPLAGSPSQPAPQPIAVPADVPAIEAAGLAGLVSDRGSIHSCSPDQPVAGTTTAASSARANAEGAHTVSASDSGTTVTDADGDDLIRIGGASVRVPGEVHDLTSGAIPGEDLAVIEGESGSRLVRALANGDLADLPLPGGVIAPREVEALAGGGALVTMLQRSSGEFADQVDVWYMSPSGELIRLTDLASMVDGDRWAAVKDVRATAAGRLMATVFTAKGSGSTDDFRSFRFVFDPQTGEAVVDAVGSGELVFDETADGIQLVGSFRVRSIEFVEMADPSGTTAATAGPPGGANPASRRCEVVPASVWGPDPDAVG
jgi:hypothetical protein